MVRDLAKGLLVPIVRREELAGWHTFLCHCDGCVNEIRLFGRSAEVGAKLCSRDLRKPKGMAVGQQGTKAKYFPT